MLLEKLCVNESVFDRLADTEPEALLETDSETERELDPVVEWDSDAVLLVDCDACRVSVLDGEVDSDGVSVAEWGDVGDMDCDADATSGGAHVRLEYDARVCWVHRALHDAPLAATLYVLPRNDVRDLSQNGDALQPDVMASVSNLHSCEIVALLYVTTVEPARLSQPSTKCAVAPRVNVLLELCASNVPDSGTLLRPKTKTALSSRVTLVLTAYMPRETPSIVLLTIAN